MGSAELSVIGRGAHLFLVGAKRLGKKMLASGKMSESRWPRIGETHKSEPAGMV